MKFNGNITLNALGQSEVQNLVVERFSATPGFNASEAGRLIYNTTSRLYYMNSGLGWVALATGGDAASLQTEVDALEASIGSAILSSGDFNPSAVEGTNIVAASSITDAINQLDAAISGKNELKELLDVAVGSATDAQFLHYDFAAGKWVNHTLVLADVTDVSATAAEVNFLSGVTSSVQTQINTEKTDRAAGDATNASAIDAEVTRATNAEGVLTTNLSDEVNRAVAAEGVLTGDLSAEVTRATGAETTISGNLSSEITRATGAEAVLQTAINAEATTARDAESSLQAAINAEVSRATAADDSHTTAIADEIAARQLADQGHDTAIADEIARATARENAIESDFNARVQGLAWKNPVRVASTGDIADLTAVTVIDGVTLVDGDRVLLKDQADATQNGIYSFILASTTLTRSVDMDVAAEFASATFYTREGSTQADLGFTQIAEVVTLGTDVVNFVQFNGAGSVTAGDGMTQVGNVINVGSADSSITVGPDTIKVSDALQTAISQNTANIATEVTRATDAESVLDAAIQQEAADRAAAVSAEVTARIADVDFEEARAIAAEAALQDNINAEANRAVAAEGANAADIAAEISRATAAEAANTTAINAEAARATAAENTLTANLASEVTRATGVEDGLRTDVDAEVIRAQAAEAALSASLSKGYFLYDGAASASHTVAHNIGSRFCNVTVIDSATNEQIIPQSVVFDSSNQLTVTFNVALACKVVVMGLGV